MKLIIDIPDEEYKTLSKMSEKEKVNELSYYERIIANGTPISTEGDLISRSALKKSFDGYTLFTANTVIEHIDNAPTVKPESYVIDSCDMNVFEPEKYMKERPQGESIRIEDGLKKTRYGKYVIYDVDFLLDNLAREVNIMESARRWKGGAE